jgi:hypothetical protein
MLRELRRQFPDSAFVFATERGGPFTPDAINRQVKRIGWRAGLPSVHATAAVMPWPRPATTPDACRIGSATDRSSTRRATRN